jgi:phage shock protein C
MNTFETIRPRAFYRRADNAMLGGVCAGLASYFGFNLRVTRILAVIAFFVAMPMAVIVYLAVVFLVPARAIGQEERGRSKIWRARRASPEQMASEVRSKTQSLDRRLARLEKYITSRRYELDEEFRNLQKADNNLQLSDDK